MVDDYMLDKVLDKTKEIAKRYYFKKCCDINDKPYKRITINFVNNYS